MRKKVLKLIITFHTTTDAMAMETNCKKLGLPGRLIPVPTSISAGCGLAWCVDLDERERLLEAMAQAGLKEQAVHECMI